MKKNNWLYFVIFFVVVLGGLFYLRDYTNLFAAGDVVFEGYTQYDDRLNSDILYASNYRLAPNTPLVSFKQDATLPGPYIVCDNSNSCGGTPGEIVNGCQIYNVPTTYSYYGVGQYCTGVCPNGGECVGEIQSCDYSGGQWCTSCRITHPGTSCGGRVIGQDTYQCKPNTCSGVTSTSTDQYGCTIYSYTTSWTQANTCTGALYHQKCSACPPGCTGGGEQCSGGTSSGDCSCSCSSTCTSGGASTSTCQGDDCFVQATGSTSNDISCAFNIVQPQKTLTQWKIENPTKLDLINLGCDWCVSKKMIYEDDLWLLVGNSGEQTRNSDCSTGTFNLPTQSKPYKFGGSSASMESTSGGSFSYASLDISLTTKQNMRDTDGLLKDLIIKFKCEGSGISSRNQIPYINSYATCTVKIGNNAYSISSDPLVNPINTKLIEMFSSRTDPNTAEIFINGETQGNIHFDGLEHVNVSFITAGTNPTLEILKFGYILPFDCVQENNEILIQQTFSGPRPFSITDLFYTPTQFCEEHPAILLSQTGRGSTSDKGEIYDKLRRGLVLNIPETQTWSIFYIAYNDGTIPGATCNPEQALNVNEDGSTNCVSFTQICGSGGVWDRTLGMCTWNTNSNLSKICGSMGQYVRYDSLEEECVLNFPAQGICEFGNYNSGTIKCEYDYDGTSCFPRFVQNGTKCIADPLAFILCDVNLSFNPQTGYCQNADGSVVKPVVSNIQDICDKLSGVFRYNTAGNPVCVFNPVGIEKVIVTEWKTETKIVNNTITIYTTQPEYKTDWTMIIIGGIALVIITFLLIKIFKRR